MAKRVLKILLVQTANMNLGDTVIGDNNFYLIKKAVAPRKCEILRYSISSRDVSQIKYVDAVVFAGGILKVTNEKFWLYIPEIINEANRHDVPVFLSGIGVEAFYPDDERSVELKKAINLPCVKGISVRDDIETLKKDYLTNNDIRVYSVHDVALWSKKTYKSSINLCSHKDELVGLGITRERLFSDYGNPQIDRQTQLDLWKGIIDRLDNINVKWKLFTNGDPNDEIFANEVLAYVGHGDKLDAPLDGVTLTQNISQFTSVIAGRMHSNIISYALNIPSVGFVWNQKLRFWGEKIGYPQRFIECEDLNAENIFSAWEKARDEGCVLQTQFRDEIYRALKEFVDNCCFIREKAHEKLKYGKYMLAPALGGIDTRYKNTNSPQAFLYSIEHGYKNFQADIRLTSDKVAVCVNRWHKDTFKSLNHPMKNAEKATAISYNEFKSCKYYNRFDTMTIEELFSLAKKHLSRKRINLVLAFGRPTKKVFKLLISKIKQIIEEDKINTKNLYLRLEQERDVEYVKNSGLEVNIIYHIVDERSSEQATLATLENGLKYCKQQGIEHLYMNHNEYTQEFDALCKKYDVNYYSSACVFTQNVIDNIKHGAYFVPSHYYDVDYITRLTK